MEPTKQGVPGDPSSSQQQPQQYPPQSALPPDRRDVQCPQPQQQYPPPFALPPQFALSPLQHAVQRPQLPSLQRPWGPYLSTQQAHRWGYIPYVGAAIPGGINASHYGAGTPYFHDHPTVPHSPVAPKRSELSVSAEEYFRPIFLPHRSVDQSSSTPSFSANHDQTSARGPQAGATDPFSVRDDDASLDPYFSALLSADQVDLRSWSPAPVIPRELTGDVGYSSACVFRLLKEGREDVRRSVFNVVLGALHFIMGSRKWWVVFLDLLLAPSFHELQAIVHVACEGEGSMMSIANDECGVTSLLNLFEAVKLYPQLRCPLINRLLDEGLFHHRKGPDLLHNIFTTSTFPYKDSSIVIRHALNNFIGVLTSTFGSMSMLKCFKTAKNNPELQAELQDLEEIILRHTVQIAKGEFSNYFLQKVLKHGCDRLRVNITDLVVEHLVSLSLDRHGTYVVQACFDGTAAGSLPLLVRLRLPRALEKFRRLSDEQLGQLVENNYASYVVCELLLAGKGGSLEETLALARRIKKMPVARWKPAVGRVMAVVRMVLP